MDNRDLAGEWINIAEADLASAEFLRSMRPVPIGIICYHCQQSAEKYLKGYLALKGEEIPKTHDLVQLNNRCRKHEDNFKQIENDCLLLTDFAVHIRYPFPMELGETDMSTALERATAIKNFVISKLNK